MFLPVFCWGSLLIPKHLANGNQFFFEVAVAREVNIGAVLALVLLVEPAQDLVQVQ